MSAHQIKFEASGFELLKLYLKNMLLTVITLGVYSFWARVRVTKFIFQHTYLMDQNFDYHATGKEKFIGFLKAIGILIVGALFVAGMFYTLAQFLDPQIANLIVTLFVYLIWIAIIPILIIGARRYLLSRTSHRGLRFRFTGQVGEIYKELVIGILLSLVTFGIYAPWMIVKLQKFLYKYSSYGDASFSFDANPKQLLKIGIIGYFLSIITLGIYAFWWEAQLFRYFTKGIRFKDVALECNLTGGQLFTTFLYVLVFTVFTLGIGLPWAVIRQYEVIFGSISYPADIDFDQIHASPDTGASALADGMSEAADALSSVANVFG